MAIESKNFYRQIRERCSFICQEAGRDGVKIVSGTVVEEVGQSFRDSLATALRMMGYKLNDKTGDWERE